MDFGLWTQDLGLRDKIVLVTGGAKGIGAGLFDTSGTPLAYASTTYTTQFPSPSLAEQDPRDWWNALGKSVRNVRQMFTQR